MTAGGQGWCLAWMVAAAVCVALVNWSKKTAPAQWAREIVIGIGAGGAIGFVSYAIARQVLEAWR